MKKLSFFHTPFLILENNCQIQPGVMNWNKTQESSFINTNTQLCAILPVYIFLKTDIVKLRNR